MHSIASLRYAVAAPDEILAIGGLGDGMFWLVGWLVGWILLMFDLVVVGCWRWLAFGGVVCCLWY